MPLPPYIHEKLADRERYQTVYAKENGSAAAPTAGLHFTQELLQKLKQGVHLVYLTLHVGLGTFRPVSVDNLEDHEMHSSILPTFWRNPSSGSAGETHVAVGTTSIRTLETIGNKFDGDIQADSGWTNIFIKPGYEWKVVDAFSTNFHPSKINSGHVGFCLCWPWINPRSIPPWFKNATASSVLGCYVHQVKESLMNKLKAATAWSARSFLSVGFIPNKNSKKPWSQWRSRYPVQFNGMSTWNLVKLRGGIALLCHEYHRPFR